MSVTPDVFQLDQIARMAGVNTDVIDQSMPEVIYAVAFAKKAGRSDDIDAHFATLEQAVGAKQAISIRSLCWALLWGKTTGNSINIARNKLLSFKAVSLLDLFLLLWYGPLFLVIGVLNLVLKVSPSTPTVVTRILGFILWVPQFLNIFPLGLVSFILSGFTVK